MKTAPNGRQDRTPKKKRKITQIDDNTELKDAPVRPPSQIFNSKYLKKASEELIKSYQSEKPFKHITLDNIMQEGIIQEIIDNLHEEYWFRKKNDLYTFKQTDDLKTSNQCGLRDLRLTIYSPQFREFLQSITGIELNDVVDISAHNYSKGGNLLCHDDEFEGRRIAFILYFVPEDWKAEDGGRLDLFSSDAQCNPIRVVKSIYPKRNRLMFFEVGPTTWHQVSEVLCDRSRLSISGWFHGAPLPGNPHTTEPPVDKFAVETLTESFPLENWVNEKYLETESKQRIRKHFEKASSIGLNDFLLPEIYFAAHQSLQEADWKPIGPPQRRHYDSLGRWGSETETSVLFNLKKFLRSPEFLQFLEETTGLKILHTNRGEFRRFKRQDYTLVHDYNHQIDEEGIDVGLGFQDEDVWKDSFGGFTTYMDQQTELLTLVPQKNTLSIVFRDKGCMRFVKFVNSSAPSTRFDFCNVYFPLITDSGEDEEPNQGEEEETSEEGNFTGEERPSEEESDEEESGQEPRSE